MTKQFSSGLFLTMLLAGCQTQPQPAGADIPVTVGPVALKYLQIDAVQRGVASGNILKAGISLHNTSSMKQTLRYRFSWLDADGFEMPGLASRWEQTTLRPLEPIALERIAPTPAAVQFRIYLFDINPSASNAQGNER